MVSGHPISRVDGREQVAVRDKLLQDAHGGGRQEQPVHAHNVLVVEKPHHVVSAQGHAWKWVVSCVHIDMNTWETGYVKRDVLQ